MQVSSFNSNGFQRPIMTPATSDLAYQNIRLMLTTGQLQPGQKLSQLHLARQLGCSTVPVVEALRKLESEGLIVKQSRKIARVRVLSRSDFEGLYLMREALEAVAARLCAQRMTPEEVQTLQALDRAYEEAWQANEGESEADVAIHRHIAQSARCPIVMEELDRFLLIEQTTGSRLTDRAARTGHPRSHRALVQAIADHDADSAEYLMKKHIQNGYQETVATLPDRKKKTRAAAGG